MTTKVWNLVAIFCSNHCLIEETKQYIRIKRHLFGPLQFGNPSITGIKYLILFELKTPNNFPLKSFCTFHIRPLEASLENSVLSLTKLVFYLELCFSIWITIFYFSLYFLNLIPRILSEKIFIPSPYLFILVWYHWYLLKLLQHWSLEVLLDISNHAFFF